MRMKSLFGRTFDARPDRIDFRDLPYRPRLVSLPDRYPRAADIKHYFPAYRASKMVLDQKQEGSCTGFGLAAVVNYLRWELELKSRAKSTKTPTKTAKVSARMLYQNARLYDEWQGEDYEGSSCRGAMKGFHKHGVCREQLWPYMANGEAGRALPGWDADAPLTPLGAYFRIDSRSLVDLQSAIFETHAIYVSANVHDGWQHVEKCRTLADAMIGPPRDPGAVGGHAFGVVGYTDQGFIIQNSWGPDWGFHGFAILPYEDWTKNGSDAWALALGAPMRISVDGQSRNGSGKKQAKQETTFRSPAARTEISLDERLRVRAPLLARVGDDPSPIRPWTNGEEANHIIYIGHAGRAERELVAANSGEDAVRIVVQDGVRKAIASGISKIAIYDHGGLNSRTEGVTRAQVMGPWFLANDIHPIFVVWQTGFFESAGDIIRIGIEKLGKAPERVEGWVVDKLRDVKDRAFEVFARDFGVKAIWENMKGRAETASLTGGGLYAAAASLESVIGPLKNKPEIHLLGHSAGAIMHGHFLKAMKDKKLTAKSIHLWAPACTVDFATNTFGAAFQNGVADAKSTYIDILSNANEMSDPCVPLAYSKSLLYLISRALEPVHKTPVLGMAKAWEKLPPDDMTFKENYQAEVNKWQDAAKGVTLDPAVTDKVVPTVRDKDDKDTIAANHGSFDNNLDVVNEALERILGAKPKVPVTDLRGF
jgi:hypothetical protein